MQLQLESGLAVIGDHTAITRLAKDIVQFIIANKWRQLSQHGQQRTVQIPVVIQLHFLIGNDVLELQVIAELNGQCIDVSVVVDVGELVMVHGRLAWAELTGTLHHALRDGWIEDIAGEEVVDTVGKITRQVSDVGARAGTTEDEASAVVL